MNDNTKQQLSQRFDMKDLGSAFKEEALNGD
jgi:hypothetical protein